MASKNIMIGSGVALAGIAGLTAAAVTVGAPESATTTKPAAQTVETQTVERAHRSGRVKARKAEDGTTEIRHADRVQTTTTAATSTATTPTHVRRSRGADDGPAHDLGDDRGGREAEAGDDRGGRETEAGDDRGGREAETGDDHGGGENEGGDDHSGHGGGGRDD